MKKDTILGATLGDCVHVAGILNFLSFAENFGYRTNFIGAAIPINELVHRILKEKPDVVALSYRLLPKTAEELLKSLKSMLVGKKLKGVRFIFGGPPPVAEVARKSGLFDFIFSGNESLKTLETFLKKAKCGVTKNNNKNALLNYPQSLVERIELQKPFPLLRHHLGLETVKKTVEHARKIALSGELDVLSIAPDQNAQEYFFRLKEMPKTGHGAGGVPVRKPADMEKIYKATRCGNYPLVRCYAGTNDLLKWAQMSKKTINIAWGAIPLFWYSELDKRSNRTLEKAIIENQQVMRWYAEQGIPLEVNDSHQWSLRDAHDSLAVAVAYLAAYNAKVAGTRYYVSQYMLNTPPETSPMMDIAKMLAKIEMIESLHDRNFTSYREIRTGLRSMVLNPDYAKGHLTASITLGMLLKPHIVHVVGYCEADHAASADEIIESCRIVRGVVRLALRGLPEVNKEPDILKRKKELISEAKIIIEAIKKLGSGKKDSLINPEILAKAVRSGILDAPHLCGSGVAPGAVVTMPVNGGYHAINPATKKPLSEKRRIGKIFSSMHSACSET